jgi:hypothetical protein
MEPLEVTGPSRWNGWNKMKHFAQILNSKVVNRIVLEEYDEGFASGFDALIEVTGNEEAMLGSSYDGDSFTRPDPISDAPNDRAGPRPLGE